MLDFLHNLACGSPQMPTCLLPSSIVVFLLYLHRCSYFHDVTFLFIACIFLTNPPSCFYKYLLLSFTCLMTIFLSKSNFRIVFLGWPLMSMPGTVRAAFLYASVTPDIFCLWRAARTLLKKRTH